MRYRFAGAAVAALIAVAAAPGGACARTLEAGQGHSFPTPSAAIAAAGAGDTVRIYPGQYFDCAVIRTDRLTVEGAGAADAVVLTDKTCAGKGVLVIEGTGITIRNITLARARVPDGNGAGIRAEGGDLTVEGVRFVNNQNGILTNAAPGVHVSVLRSQFLKNGVCGDYCAHAIYAGKIASLVVRDSLFRGTRDGHDIKSRAASTEVTGCDIQDGPDSTASYLIELPNGGRLLASGNILEKGPLSGNHAAAISIGTEGVDQPTPALVVRDNHFTNDGDYTTIFVRNMTATEAELRGNVLRGAVVPLRGDGSAQ